MSLEMMRGTPDDHSQQWLNHGGGNDLDILETPLDNGGRTTLLLYCRGYGYKRKEVSFTNGVIWLMLAIMAILMWAATSLLYKVGVDGGKEEHICLKYSVCVGTVFFVIALVYLVTRDEPFTIWDSAVQYWPMTAFGIVYAVINTISFNGYVYNEAAVESPLEGISGGTSTMLDPRVSCAGKSTLHLRAVDAIEGRGNTGDHDQHHPAVNSP